MHVLQETKTTEKKVATAATKPVEKKWYHHVMDVVSLPFTLLKTITVATVNGITEGFNAVFSSDFISGLFKKGATTITNSVVDAFADRLGIEINGENKTSTKTQKTPVKTQTTPTKKTTGVENMTSGQLYNAYTKRYYQEQKNMSLFGRNGR